MSTDAQMLSALEKQAILREFERQEMAMSNYSSSPIGQKNHRKIYTLKDGTVYISGRLVWNSAGGKTMKRVHHTGQQASS